ncbi:unnamed protein product [Adineta steineri]|uniref:Uncharacterized protein n=1 Tax=Adineta steineri TaxID=433720 RepID=A0A818MU57_9BILA|nr:unnamed protein product [Adineta steineri]CAF3595234.1 unnamed protein product [Adineta steineri]
MATDHKYSTRSKWPRNTLVVVPAIWKEINWTNPSNWSSWLREGLELYATKPRTYHVHLYQRFDPSSNYPYNYPYCMNIREESGVYLQFIHDYYHDLPDKMLFIHGNPFVHTKLDPIQSALCFHDDVQFASVNDNREFIKKRSWTYWPRDPSDNIGLMYKCAKRILYSFGYFADSILNPNDLKRKDENLISAFCCAQFYVTKARIHHYTYEQWVKLYDMIREPYCTTPTENTDGLKDIQWFGGTLEHLWHVILGLSEVDSPLPIAKTTTDRCMWLRPSCRERTCFP